MDKSSAGQEIHKSDATVHNLWKIWRSAPSGTGSYGRQEGSLSDEIWVRYDILKACCKSKYPIFGFFYPKVLHRFNNFDALLSTFFWQILLQGCFIECEISRSPMILYQSPLYSTTVLYDI